MGSELALFLYLANLFLPFVVLRKMCRLSSIICNCNVDTDKYIILYVLFLKLLSHLNIITLA